MDEIALVVPYRFLPPRNGGHQAALGFASALATYKKVVVVSTPDNEPSAETPFKLLPLLPSGVVRYLSLRAALSFYRLLKSGTIQYVVFFQPFIGLMLGVVCRILGIKYLVYVQNIEYQRFKSLHKPWWPIVKAIEKWVYRSSWRLLFIAPTDLEEAVTQFGLNAGHCATVPYGVNHNQAPADRADARILVTSRHQLEPSTRFLLFFGPQHYQPNREAVDFINAQLEPYMQHQVTFPYRIFICGGGMDAERQALLSPNIQYLGFVSDIENYIKAADVVLNPITSGGGVKTKVIEAIGLGATVVSAFTGSIGVDADVCGQKLLIVPDGDPAAFAAAVKQALDTPAETPRSFYELYYWARAIQPALNWLN